MFGGGRKITRSVASKASAMSSKMVKSIGVYVAKNLAQKGASLVANRFASSTKSRTSSAVRRRSSRKSGGTGDSIRTATVVKSGKAKNAKKVKRVKVSPKFKKMVNQVIDKREPTGTYQAVYYDWVSYDQANGQNVFRLSKNFNGVVFSTQWTNYLASRLFNDKSAPSGAAHTGNVNTSADYTLADLNNVTKLFSNETLKVNIISNNLAVRIRSNSHRIYYLTMYLCTPKNQQNTKDPINSWTDVLDTLASATIVNGANSNIDYSPTTVTRLYQDPRMWPQFNKYWSVQTFKCEIQPGEAASFNMPLPTGMCDFKKFIADDILNTYNKFYRHLFCTYHCDLVQTNQTNPVQKSIRAADVPVHNLAFEMKLNTKISMPEQTGFIYPADQAAGVTQVMGQRIDRYCFDYFGGNINTTQTPNLRVDPINSVVDYTTN